MKRTALVNCPVLPLRARPEHEATRTDEVLYGMKVQIEQTEEKACWYRVMTHYRYTGFSYADGLLCDDALLARWEALARVIVCARYADVLAAPRVQGGLLCSLPRGALLLQLSTADINGWVRVGLCDGGQGYIKEGFIAPYVPAVYEAAGNRMPTESFYVEGGCACDKAGEGRQEMLRRRIVETALSYLGCPYRWGGKTPYGIDCSGLTFMSYLLNDRIIYRDARIKAGFPVREIAPEQLREADLLYFPGHIALYLGKGRYIHATGKNGSDGVVINSLRPWEEDYRADLAEAEMRVGSIF